MCSIWETDSDNGKSHKYVCITTNHPDTKSNPNPTNKQQAVDFSNHLTK